MATKEELFAAIKLLRENCIECPTCKCQMRDWCFGNQNTFSEPWRWPDPKDWSDKEEGGGEDD